jgi:hypothetical protein
MLKLPRLDVFFGSKRKDKNIRETWKYVLNIIEPINCKHCLDSIAAKGKPSRSSISLEQYHAVRGSSNRISPAVTSLVKGERCDELCC